MMPDRHPGFELLQLEEQELEAEKGTLKDS